MKKRGIRLLSLLLAILMVAGMLEAPLGLTMVNAADDAITPSIPEATEYYINNAFETVKNGAIDISDIYLLKRDDSNIAEVRKGDAYIYMEKNSENNPRISRDLSDVVTSSYIVVEAQIASTKLSGAALQLTGTAAAGEEAQTLSFVTIDAEGKIYAMGNDTGKVIVDSGTFVTVTVAVNADANTYSLWIGGEQVLYNGSISGTAFGMVSAMAIELNGDVTNAANLMVDNLKVYSWNYAPTSYYENNFNENADGITIATMTGNAINYSEHNSDDGNLYLRSHNSSNAVAFWNKGEGNTAIIPLADQFVVTFDHSAMNKWANWRLNLVDEDGKRINVLWNNADGSLKRLYVRANGSSTQYQTSLDVSTDTNSNVYPVALAFDMAAMTYSYAGVDANGAAVENRDMKLRVPSTGFGTVQYIEFLSRGDDTAGAGNLYIDNFKVYEGTEIRDPDVVGVDPSVIPTAVDTYIDNSFETNDMSELEFFANDSINKAEVATPNHYVYLERNGTSGSADVQIYKSFGSTITSKYVVVSADIASTHFQAARFYFNGSSGNNIGPNFRFEDNTYKVYWGSSDVMNNTQRYTINADGKFNNVTVVFNFNAGTYQFWFNGTMIKNGTWNGGNSLNNFKISLNAVGESLMVDNLQVYSYAPEQDDSEPSTTVPETTGPSGEPGTTVPETTGPVEPDYDPNVKVFYNNNFSANADGIDFAAMGGTSANYSKYDAEGKYLYLRCHNNNGPVATWNRGEGGQAAVALTSQFVVSFDFAAISAWSNFRFYLVDENGKKMEILWNRGDGGIKRFFLKGDNTIDSTRYFSAPVSAANDLKFRNITLAFDMNTKTYSYWSDNYNADAIIEDLNLPLPDTSGTFGTPQYIELLSRGDNEGGTTAVGGNLIIDNLKIYEGATVLESVGPQNQFPPKPEPEGDKVWYNNDFNTNADGITFIDTISKHVLEGNQGHLYLRGIGDTKIFYWNRGTNGKPRAPLTDKFVISFDMSSTALSDGSLKLVDEKGETIEIINFTQKWNYLRVRNANNNNGVLTSAYTNICWNGDDGRNHHMEVAINTETGKFSLWKEGALQLDSLYLDDADGSFGTVRYIFFTANDTTVATKDDGKDQYYTIDNLKVYEGTKPRADVGEVTEIPTLPEDGNGIFRPDDVDPGNGRYYDSNFENKSKDELVLNGGSEITKEPNGNHSIKMNLGAWTLWNYSQKWELSDYVVHETTIKAVNMGTLLFQIKSLEGNSFYALKFRKTGEITPAHAPTTEKLLRGEAVNVAVAINSVDNTYSVWYDGVMVLENSKISSSKFGTFCSTRWDVSDGDLAKTEWRLDNMKVYQGFSPDDYPNTKLLTEQPKDESWLEEMMGTQSPMANYATEELAIIDAAGAVIVNTDLYTIYQNGKKTQGTKAQVDALVKNTAGKTVTKNDLGLVIISPKALELTATQIDALHDYLIYDRPTAATLKSLFNSVSKNEHPRVILTPEKLAKLRSDYKNNDFVRELAEAQIKSADLVLKSKHYEFSDQNFQRGFRDRWPKLALAYLLTGNAKYKDFLWEDIVGASKFPNWKPNDALLLGDCAYGIAIAYDWLYDAWTPAQRKLIEQTIYDKILYYQHRAVYGKSAGGGTYWASNTNRNAVSNGGPGMAMIAVFNVYPDKIADIMEKTYHLIEIMMDPIAPDGANTEGPAYWDYQMRYLVPFLQSSLNTFGTDFNLMDAPGFDRTADFYLDIDGMTGVNNLHDATADSHGIAGEMFALADMLGRPDLAQTMLAKYEVYNTHDGFWSLIYYNSDIKYEGAVDRELDSYYQGFEFVSMRSSWLNSAGIYASLHAGGHDGASHNHVDTGTFVLDIGGQRFASDYGKEDYNLKASGTYRHYYYRIRPEGHNVFVINPDKTGQDIGMKLVQEEVTKFVSKSRGAFSIVSMDKAYAGYAQSATRGMMLGDDRKSVLIRDEIRGMANATNEVWWFMQMENVETTISADGKSAILSKGGVDVRVQIASNASDWEIKVLPPEEMYPLEGLPDQDKQNPNTNYTRLAIVFKTGKDVNINVKFAEVDDPKGDTPIKDVALANWSIPDGVLVADPTVYGIEIGGVEVPNFSKNQTFYNFELPYGTEECPDVKVIGGEGCDITIKKPKKLPGYLNITVASKTDSKAQTKYKIYLTVSGPIKVEVSDTPEPQNFAKNMLDGNLNTKWACNGAGWALFTFPSPQKVDAIWLCAMEMTLRVQPFNVEVSEDGVNFKMVWEGTTTMLPEGSKDQLQEFKIPEGTYKAIRINVTGAQYPDGRDYGWSSIFEVMFYYQGKPIEIILQTSDPNSEFTDNPNDIVVGPGNDDNTNNNTGDDVIDPNNPNANKPGADDDQTGNNGSKSGLVWLIVGLCVAAVAVAGVIVFIVLKKKKAASAGESTETEATEASAE